MITQAEHRKVLWAALGLSLVIIMMATPWMEPELRQSVLMVFFGIPLLGLGFYGLYRLVAISNGVKAKMQRLQAERSKVN